MVLERSAPARVQMIGTFSKSMVRDANLPAGLRCPASRGAGAEPKIVLNGDNTRNLRTIIAILAVFSFEPGQYLFMQIVQDHQLLLHSVLNDLFNRFFFHLLLISSIN